MSANRRTLLLALALRDEVERRLAAHGVDPALLGRDEALLAVWPHARKLAKIRGREKRMRQGRGVARRLADDAAARGADDEAARGAAWWAGSPGGQLRPLDVSAWRVALVAARGPVAGREAA